MLCQVNNAIFADVKLVVEIALDVRFTFVQNQLIVV